MEKNFASMIFYWNKKWQEVTQEKVKFSLQVRTKSNF